MTGLIFGRLVPEAVRISTARSQQAAGLIEAAEGLSGAPDAKQAALLERAKDRVDLYDEHTFGYYDSEYSHPQAQTTELLKQAIAHEGHELAAFAVMNALERIACNPIADRGLKGVLLCNPGPHSITVRPELPAAWFSASATSDRTYRASRMFFDGRPWGKNFPGPAPRVFGPVSLKPNSWKAISFAHLPSYEGVPSVSHEILVQKIERREANFAPVANFQRRVGVIKSPYHELRYDPDSGRVISLVDLDAKREVLAPKENKAISLRSLGKGQIRSLKIGVMRFTNETWKKKKWMNLLRGLVANQGARDSSNSVFDRTNRWHRGSNEDI